MLQNKRETVEKIAQHIGVEYTSQLIEDTAAATEFKVMKKAKYEEEAHLRKLYHKDFTTYRKGEELV